jgi:hypothetical protein
MLERPTTPHEACGPKLGAALEMVDSMILAGASETGRIAAATARQAA